MRFSRQLNFENATFNNSTEYSEVQKLDTVFGYCIILTYSGSSIDAKASLEASIDQNTWVGLPDDGDTAYHTLDASGGSHIWNVPNAFYPYVRLKIVSEDSNDVTVSAQIFCKGV